MQRVEMKINYLHRLIIMHTALPSSFVLYNTLLYCSLCTRVHCVRYCTLGSVMFPVYCTALHTVHCTVQCALHCSVMMSVTSSNIVSSLRRALPKSRARPENYMTGVVFGSPDSMFSLIHGSLKLIWHLPY